MSSEAAKAALAAPPFIEVAGIPNFRDLGGYAVASPSNQSIKREVIYRCAEPTQVTKDGISTMKRLGITHIYDLRSVPEIQRMEAAGRGGIVEWEGCERVFVPVFRDEDYSPEGLAVRLRDYASDDPDVSFLPVLQSKLIISRVSRVLTPIFSIMLLRLTGPFFFILLMSRRSLLLSIARQ